MQPLWRNDFDRCCQSEFTTYEALLGRKFKPHSTKEGSSLSEAPSTYERTVSSVTSDILLFSHYTLEWVHVDGPIGSIGIMVSFNGLMILMVFVMT